ncbi:MAG: YitT family protein [Hyphomicrobiaceae bacterium]|nr:YitT family protein [Hyphomicrobiaceae bacterium]
MSEADREPVPDPQESGRKATAQAARAHLPGWFGDWTSTATHHSPWEDAQGIAFSVLLISFGITLFQQLGLITSGIAGWSLVLHYAAGWPVGVNFFVLNLPFYALAIWRLGWGFTVKTVLAVTLLSVLLEAESRWVSIAFIEPAFGAVLGGVLVGFGLLGVLRHRSSVGGVTILAVWIEDMTGVRAGVTLFLFDLTVFGTALFVAPPDLVAYSVLGAVVLNVFLAVNHRRDRYIAR